jgi:hypothetical protein
MRFSRCAIATASLALLACSDSEGAASTAPWVASAGPSDGGDADDDDDDGGDASGSADDDASDPSDDDGEPSDDDGDPSDDGDPTAPPPGDVPQLGTTFTVVATAADGLDRPRDLQFAPDHPDQLWTANAGFHGVVILFDPGTAEQRAEPRADYYGAHFMATVSSIAFGDGNRFSSCQESRDEWNGAPQPPDDFMGPTLWDADLDVFAMVHQGDGTAEGSHLDMLHQSPLCMGIAWASGNAYWVFDGLNGHVVRYDFKSDHGPGGSDHTDASIRRYVNAVVQRRADVPGHMVIDPASDTLYVADTGTGQVMALDTTSGSSYGELNGNWDGVGEYSGWDGAAWTTAFAGLSAPSGLEIADGVLFVSDFDTGEIIAVELASMEELGRVSTGAAGIMGLAIGPDDRLWYADGVAQEIVRVDP